MFLRRKTKEILGARNAASRVGFQDALTLPSRATPLQIVHFVRRWRESASPDLDRVVNSVGWRIVEMIDEGQEGGRRKNHPTTRQRHFNLGKAYGPARSRGGIGAPWKIAPSRSHPHVCLHEKRRRLAPFRRRAKERDNSGQPLRRMKKRLGRPSRMRLVKRLPKVASMA